MALWTPAGPNASFARFGLIDEWHLKMAQCLHAEAFAIPDRRPL
jgi:hypothetical protein